MQIIILYLKKIHLIKIKKRFISQRAFQITSAILFFHYINVLIMTHFYEKAFNQNLDSFFQFSVIFLVIK